MQTCDVDSPRPSLLGQRTVSRAVGAGMFALVIGLSGCSGSESAVGGSSGDSTEDSAQSNSSAAGTMSPDDQIAYGCQLADKVKTDFPDSQAWTDSPPELGEDRVLSELMSIGSLFGGAAPMGDPVDQEVQDLGRELVGAVNTLQRDQFGPLVDSTISVCGDFLSTSYEGQPSAADTSETGQVVYGCRIVEQTLEQYPDAAAWESEEPKFGDDPVWNEVAAAGGLFGSGGGGTSEPVDAELEKIGYELISDGATMDTDGLSTSLDQARESCSNFDA